MRVLVVDDNEDMRSLVRLLFDLDGVETVEADDACPAARAWNETRPDFVVLDYQLPTHSGLDVAEWMLAQDATTNIVLFSAYLDDAAIARAEALGVRACVSKERVRELPSLARSLSLAA